MINAESSGGLPLYLTIPAFLTGIAEAYGNRTALTWFTRKEEKLSCTYRELADRSARLCSTLCVRGLAGKRVALVGENSADWLVAFFAALSCGCAVVCTDTEQSDDTIRDMLRAADAQVVFLSSPFVSICTSLLHEPDTKVETLFLMGGGDGTDVSATMPDLLEQGYDLICTGTAPTPPAIQPDQTAEFVFTSGTTSRSKIVMLSHRAILQNVHDASVYVCLYEKVFTSLPFYHAYGLNCAVLCSLYQGAHLYINGNLKNTSRDLQLAQPDTIFAVPLLVEAIHNQFWVNVERTGKTMQLRRGMKLASVGRRFHIPLGRHLLEDVRRKAFGRMRLIICGGAHLNQDILKEFDLMGIALLQGYGITECSPLISVNCNAENRLGSVGCPLESFELSLVDGEIWVRGPAVMQGYYKDSKQTEEVLQDGWFKTGDLGYQDKDGFLYLTGRKKNLIVFKNGKKLSPEKLEALLAPLPFVKEVMVYGTANGSSTDDVKLTACIFPDPKQTEGMSSYDILSRLHYEVDQINARLPVYQQIQMITIRENEFDKTATKKIKRYDLQ